MDTLYHYCSTSSFLSILSNRTIRLSSLSCSNDSLEGKLLTFAIEQLSNLLKLNNDELNYLKDHTSVFERIADGLGFCLSAEGNILSQWRGYANNGTGFSIGFSKAYLEDLVNTKDSENSLQLRKIQYGEEYYILPKEIGVKIGAIKEAIKTGASDYKPEIITSPLTTNSIIPFDKNKIARSGNLISILMPLVTELYTIKTKDFNEEKEWRVILTQLKDGHNSNFMDGGDKIIQYTDININSIKEKVINRIYIGPKNETPIYIVRNLLDKNGFQDVEIIKSGISYR